MHLSSPSPSRGGGGEPRADVGTLLNVHFKVLVFPCPWGIIFLQSPQYLAKPSTQLDLKMHFRTLFWFFEQLATSSCKFADFLCAVKKSEHTTFCEAKLVFLHRKVTSGFIYELERRPVCRRGYSVGARTAPRFPKPAHVSLQISFVQSKVSLVICPSTPSFFNVHSNEMEANSITSRFL